jgi:hypothetical protein
MINPRLPFIRSFMLASSTHFTGVIARLDRAIQ